MQAQGNEILEKASHKMLKKKKTFVERKSQKNSGALFLRLPSKFTLKSAEFWLQLALGPVNWPLKELLGPLEGLLGLTRA